MLLQKNNRVVCREGLEPYNEYLTKSNQWSCKKKRDTLNNRLDQSVTPYLKGENDEQTSHYWMFMANNYKIWLTESKCVEGWLLLDAYDSINTKFKRPSQKRALELIESGEGLFITPDKRDEAFVLPTPLTDDCYVETYAGIESAMNKVKGMFDLCIVLQWCQSKDGSEKLNQEIMPMLRSEPYVDEKQNNGVPFFRLRVGSLYDLERIAESDNPLGEVPEDWQKRNCDFEESDIPELNNVLRETAQEFLDYVHDNNIRWNWRPGTQDISEINLSSGDVTFRPTK